MNVSFRKKIREFLISFINKYCFYLPDSLFLRIKFRVVAGYKLHLDKPVTYNEKLQWLKLNDRHSEYTQMVDKVAVKDYVSSKIGSSYVIPTLGVWGSLDDVNWSSLPQKFVLKNAGDSGGVVICTDKDKLDKEGIKRRLNTLSAYRFYMLTKEYPYKDVPKRYIAEEYLVDESGYELKDYKFFCFDGVPKFVQVDFDRFKGHKRNIYDMNWNYIDLQIEYPTDPTTIIDKPVNFEKMQEVAGILSKGIPHVRVDLYNVKGQIYFGELTFFHGSGMEHFIPKKWDYNFGELIKLPN